MSSLTKKGERNREGTNTVANLYLFTCWKLRSGNANIINDVLNRRAVFQATTNVTA